LIDDWARDLGIKIEWVHGWEKDGTLRATGFGYYPGTTNNPATMTVVIPIEERDIEILGGSPLMSSIALPGAV
jgi:hypothetical protein